MKIEFNMDAWDETVRGIVDENLVPRAEKIADACNSALADKVEPDGYVAGTVSIEGGPALTKRDYRATVITRTNAAKKDNALNNRLIHNFHLAEGGL